MPADNPEEAVFSLKGTRNLRLVVGLLLSQPSNGNDLPPPGLAVISQAGNERPPVLVAVGIGVFCHGVLNKETALPFPLVILRRLAADNRSDEVRGPSGGSSKGIMPLGATALPYILIRFGPTDNKSDIRHLEISAGEISSGVSEFFSLVLDYAKRFAWPFDLSAAYKASVVHWTAPGVMPKAHSHELTRGYPVSW